MRKTTQLFLALFVLVTGVGCDQVTKQIAAEKLSASAPVSFLGDTVRIQYAENSGAFLGLGNTLPRAMRFWLLTVTTAGLLRMLAWILIVKWEMPRTRFTAVALILAGGMGNLIDRVLQDGVVVDFINVGIGPVRTGIFNVADVAITSGVIILLAESMRKHTKTRIQT